MKSCPKCNSNFDDSVGFCPRDGEVLDEASSDMVGKVLDGQYEVEAFIARGGMGALYRARHILLGDRVVIKTLRSEMRNNSEWLRRFQREGRAARSFRHPNSVTVYDLRTTSDGMIYMVMEYVEGHTLDKELKDRGRFSPEEAFTVLEPVASVLDAAHQKGVVHRDLKPENVMIGTAPDGGMIVKVLDLGIAKMQAMAGASTSEATSLTVAGQILGTPYYMSPEQWGEVPRDGNPEVDGRTDIYSLGVMFYELIAGQKPLGGRTLAELRHEHISAPLRSLTEVIPSAPVALSQAIARSMAKDRNDRPSTAAEFMEEARAAIGIPAGRPSISGSSGPLSDSRASHHGQVRETSADVSQATLVANDVPSTPAHRVAAPDTRLQRPAETSVGSHGAAVETSVMTGSGTAAQSFPAQAVPKTTSATETPTRAVHSETTVTTSSSAPKIIIGAVVLALLILGGGGLLAWRWLHPKPITADSAPAKNATGTEGPLAPASSRDAIDYWFEAMVGSKPSRIAAVPVTAVSGQQFRFHFIPHEHGYLYIIGPGGNNASTSMLTAEPSKYARTNEVAAGQDFVFPSGSDLFTLDKQAGSDDFTVIFSPQPLLYPAVLTDKPMQQLKPADVKQLDDFEQQHKSAAPELTVKDQNGEKMVSVSESRASSSQNSGQPQEQPILFQIRINHK